MALQLDLDGTNIATLPATVIADSVLIRTTAHARTGTMTAQVAYESATPFPYGDEAEAILHDGGTLWYGGFVRRIRRSLMAPGKQLITIECQDYSTLPGDDVVDGVGLRSAAETDKARITWLFGAWGTKGVTIGAEVQVLRATMPDQDFTGMTLAESLDMILELTGADWYVDSARALHTFLVETYYAPFDLSDTPNNVTTFAMSDLELPDDSTGVKNAIYYIPGEGGTAVPTWYPDPGTWPTASQTKYGLRAASLRDERITIQGTLDDYGAAFLVKNEWPSREGSCTVYKTGLAAGQIVEITAAAFPDLAGVALSAEPYRITAVETSFVGSTPRYSINFGDPQRALSSAIASISAQAVDPLPQVDAALANAIAADFANGIIRPQIVNALPSLPDAAYPEGFFVVLTTDRKLYISTGTSWEVKVDGSDMVVGSIGAAALSAVIVLASSILTAASGARCEMSNLNGFVAYDSLGAIRVQIPITDNPVSFIAEVQATTLTVIGSAAFQAAVSLGKNSVTTLQAGVVAPNAAPTLTQGLATPLALAATAGWTTTGCGACGYYDSVGGADGATPCFVAAQSDGAGNFRIAEWKLSDGSLSRTTNLTNWGGPSTIYQILGASRIGAYWYLNVYTDSNKMIFAHAARSTGIFAAGYLDLTSYFYHVYVGPLATDGTYLYILGYATTNLTARVVKCNTSMAYVSTTALTLPSAPPAATLLRPWNFVIADDGDGGGTTWWMDLSWDTSTAYTIYQFTTAGAVIANTNWPGMNYASTHPRALIWDGTNFWEYDDDSAGLQIYSNITTVTDPYWVGYAWYDDAGTTHETVIGPRASITMQKRRQLTVTTATIPVGGADDPDKCRVYIKPNATDPGPGNFKLQATDALTVRTLTTYNAAGAADGAGTAFPNGTGAILQSAGSEWQIRGDGNAGFANLTVTALYAIIATFLRTPNIITPSLTASVNDWNPTGLATCAVIFLGSNGAYNITGLAGQPIGTRIRIINSSASAITLVHYSGSSTYKFIVSGGANKVLAAYGGSADMIVAPDYLWYVL